MGQPGRPGCLWESAVEKAVSDRGGRAVIARAVASGLVVVACVYRRIGARRFVPGRPPSCRLIRVGGRRLGRPAVDCTSDDRPR